MATLALLLFLLGAFGVQSARAQAPSMPGGVNAAGTTGSVTVTWTAVSGAASYKIYRSTTSGGEGTTPYATGVTGTSYTDSSVTDGNRYNYTVSAVDGSGNESAQSYEAWAFALDAPATPSAVVGSQAVTLLWGWVAPGYSYRIYRGTSPGAEVPIVTSYNGLNYTDTGLTNGTTYYYKITTLVSPTSESVPSPEISVTPHPPLTAPSLTAVPGSSTISLAWSAVSGATGYNVKRAAQSGGWYTTLTTTTGTTYTDMPPTSGDTYYYVVSAVDGSTEGPDSNEAAASTGNVNSLTDIADSFVQSDAPDTNYGNWSVMYAMAPSWSTRKAFITFDLTAAGGAVSNASLELFKGSGPSDSESVYGVSPSSWSESGITWNNAPSLTGSPIATVSTGSAGQYYSYDVTSYVQAQQAAGATAVSFAVAGNASTFVAFNTREAHWNLPLLQVTVGAPVAPLNLTATGGSGQVQLSWNAVPGATSYNLYRGTGTGSTPSSYQTGLTGASYTDTGVTNGTTYTYLAKAVSANGEGAASNTASATPSSTSPGIPISCGETVLGALTTTSAFSPWQGQGYYADKYAFTATAGDTITVTMNSQAFPPLVNVLGPDGQVLGGQGWINSPASVTITPTISGVYTIDATTTSQYATGTYTLAVSCDGTQPPVLAATASTGSVALSWQPLTGATSYTIESGTTSGGPYTPLATVTGTSYTDSTFTTGPTYYVAYATYPAGQSALSNEVKASLAATIPISCGQTVTGNLADGNVDQYGDYTQTYSFSGTAGELVLIRFTPSNFSGYFFVQDPSGSYISLGAPLPSTGTYTIGIRSYSSWSTGTYTLTLDCNVPSLSLPRNLTAVWSGSQVNLSWNGISPNADTYNVKRATASGGPYTTIASVSGAANWLNLLSYADTTAVSGTTYYYVVSAVVSGVEGENSDEAVAIPQTPPTPVSISCGDTVSGTLTAASGSSSNTGWTCYDNQYAFTATAGESVTVTLSTGAFQPRLIVTDAGGNVVGSAWGYGGPNSATGLNTIATTCTITTAGPCTIDVTTIAPETTGAYTLSLSCSNVPAPPTLTAVSANPYIRLNWTASTGATGYNLYRRTADTAFTLLTSTTGTAYTDAAVSVGPYYIYTVTATGTAGESAQSNWVSQNVTDTPPGAPYGLSAASGDGQVTLTWYANSDANSFNIKRSAVSGGPYTTVGTSSTTSFVDTGLTDGTTYYYVVSAVNGAGESDNSAEASAFPYAAPAVPTGLAATCSLGSNPVTIHVSWNSVPAPVPGFTVYYNIERSTDGINWEQTDRTAYSTSFDDEGLNFGATYYYRIQSESELDYDTAIDIESSDWSAPVSITTMPAAPMRLTATAGMQQVSLSWSASATATGYNVYRASVSGGPYTLVGSTTGATTYTDTGLAPIQTYYVVTAVSASGESPYSNEASAIPNAPDGTAAYHINAGGPAVSPYAVDEFYSGGDISVGTPNLDTSGVTNPAPDAVYDTCRFGSFSYSLPGLSPNATYTVRLHFVDPAYTLPGQRIFDVTINGTQVLTNFDIVAQTGKEGRVVALPFTTTADSGGNIAIVFTPVVDSPLVNAIDVTTGSGSPGPALTLQATPGDAQVVLTWSGVNADTYNVKRSTTKGGPYTTIATGVTAQTYTDTGLTNNTPYYYVVSGVDSTGEGPNSNEASAIPSADITGSSALKIDCGGGEIDPFAADQGFTGGDAFSNPMWIDLSGVTAPAPTGVYLSAREGTFNYTVTGLTPASAYTLRLHFAEIGSDVYAPGQRVFDVTANGSTVLSAFDITGAAGTTGRAVVEQENVTADSTGTLVIGTSPVLGDAPILNGLEIISGSSAPSAPYNLIASSGNAQVALAWGSVTDATGYNVKRSSTSGGPYTTIGTATTTGYTDSTVTNGQTYYYVVSAVNATGESDNSNQAEGDPEASNGAVVKINSGGGQVGAFSYDQDFSGGGQDYLTSTIDTSGVANAAPAAVYQSRRFVFGSATYTIPNLTPSGQYTVRLHFADFPTDIGQQRLTSITINGASAYPSYDIAQSAGDRLKAVVEQWNTTADTTGNITIQLQQSGGDPGQINGLEILNGYSVPSAPRNLIALPDNNVVQLYWNAKNGVTGFTVKRSTTSGGPYTTLASGLTGTSYTDSTAVNGTTYYYVVTATNGVGESLPSNEAIAEPLAAGAVEYKVNAGGPAVPPFAQDQYFDSFTWGNAVGSGISTSGVSNPAPEAVYETRHDAPYNFTYTFPHLTPGETYTVRLHFAEFVVNGPGQRYEGATINGVTVLNNFDIFQAANGVNKAVVEQFTTTADASGQIAVTLVWQNVSNVQVNGLEVDTGATYPPSPPQNLRAIAGNTSVGLAWLPSIGATSYNVKRGTTSGGPCTTIATGVTGTTYTDPTSPSSGTYFYVVTAVNANGESDPSNEAQPVPPFTLWANPVAVTVVQGGTAVTTIGASSAVDFTAPITVSASTPPTDMDVWSYPGEIDLFEQQPLPDSTMTANTKLHLFAASDTPVGTYTLTITGTSGDYTATTTVTVTVTAP